MKQIVFLLEEPSAEAMLQAVVPRIVGEEINVRYIVFQGKQDLEKRIELKLRGWQMPNTCFIVMRDQDSGNCIEIKRTLQQKVNASGKGDVTLIRIACSELESFYLGDLNAVEQGLGISGIARRQNNHKYRQPDILRNAANELDRLTKGKYKKLLGSRAIAPYLRLDENKSISFNILIEGIRKVVHICYDMGNR